ncbi:hypothetical protein SAMN04487783_0622 [Agrococcus baldri]|uniref:Lipoprotein LpqB N-terminal domain-containing protein n=1 Tax=Agrococcus baldri TaxID=153730 RepID=A0AA94HKW5_9MICO|nr:hypothetical protein [Agrococcus baldri]SFS02099.1 hypothetical protein SAMN04487783_0622 [Agrococcus baldri]
MDTASGRPDRTVLVAIVAVVALVVVALVVVFTRGGAAPIDEAAPAGVVQRYTEAVIAGDEEAARAYLVQEVRDDCERIEAGMLDEMRVTLTSTTEREDTADVDVSIVTTSGGLLGPSEYREDASFDLVREGSDWVIATTPWQFTICTQAAP